MKQCIIVLCCILYLSWSVVAGSSKENFPTISAEAEVSKFVHADECYVLFLLSSTGDSMSAAKVNFEKKEKEFSETVKRDFPEAKFDTIPVNFGTRDFSSYRAAESPFIPDMTKILLFTLPPKEDMAIRLLDCGLKSGLMPFCATSRDGTYGAIFFGLKNSQTELDSLYPLGKRKLFAQAEKLAEELGREIVKMDDISRIIPRDNSYELRFREIKVALPSEFCSIDRNRIKISLTLHANFQVREKNPVNK